jgi:hypothetical protein
MRSRDMAGSLLVFGGEFDGAWTADDGAAGARRDDGAVAKRQTRRSAKPSFEGSSPSRTSISKGVVIP